MPLYEYDEFGQPYPQYPPRPRVAGRSRGGGGRERDMKQGMLWFDNDPKRSFADRLARAAAHYRRKYGHEANLVLVHPTASSPDSVNGISVRQSKAVMPNYLWLGVSE